MNPMITVIIPLYNGEHTIQRCIESIINQSYKSFEILIVNDGSTDQSASVADSLCHKFTDLGYTLRVIHKKNGGVSSARNAGIENARGKYFVCVDCDDAVAPSYLEDFIRPMEEYEDVGHVCCGFICKSQKDRIYIYSETETYSLTDRKDYMVLAQKIMVQSPCFRLYRTDIVQQQGIRMKEELSLGEDMLFNLEYFDAVPKTKFYIINRPNYIYYDFSQTSLNHRYRENLYQVYSLLNKKMKDYLIRWDAWDSESRKLFYNHVFSDYMIILKNTLDSRNTMNYFQKFKFNNSVLRDELFWEALHNKTIKLPFYLEYAYRTRCYPLVGVVEITDRVVHKIFRRSI